MKAYPVENKWTSIVLSGVMATLVACTDGTTNEIEKLPPATVKSVPRSEIPQTAILMQRFRGEIMSRCNMSTLDDGKNYTAKHCVFPLKEDEHFKKDIIGANNFSEIISEILKGDDSMDFVVDRNPKQSKKSDKDYKNHRDNNPLLLQIRGCLPDSSQQRMYCYKITGYTIHARSDIPGYMTMRLTEEDIRKISGRRDSSGSLGGMSGSPVFDADGKFFGVLSAQNIEHPYLYIQAISTD